MNDIAALLKTFADAHGMSGYEEHVATLLRRELEPLTDEVTVDTMGNVIGVRNGEGPTIMVAAHMDEIGAMVPEGDGPWLRALMSLGFESLGEFGWLVARLPLPGVAASPGATVTLGAVNA